MVAASVGFWLSTSAGLTDPAARGFRFLPSRRHVAAPQSAAILKISSWHARICAFYGVVIYMYWNERDHPVAHFHAYHAGRRASVSVDGKLLAGGLEPRALRLVQEWAVLRRAELAANWEKARRSDPLSEIDPLP